MESFSLKPVAIGVFFALFALLAGEIHGMGFGAKEDSIKKGFKETAAASATLKSEEEKKKAADKAWKYLKRAHMHYMGLGAMALALSIFIGLAKTKPLYKTVVSTAVGFGAFVYPTFWSWVACKSASVGAHEAKESLSIVAQAGTGIGFLGLLGTIAIAIIWLRAE